MRWPVLYSVFCVFVLGAFAYGKYRGLDLVDTRPTPSSGTTSSTSSGSSFHYVGTSGGYHK